VHLERAARLGDRLGGHLVQGHVDGVGEVRSRAEVGASHVIWIEVDGSLAKYVAAKGSICIDGVSMTVNEVDGCRFRVNVVPHTARVTRLASLRAGGAVNIEVDVIAKYVERLLGGHLPSGITVETLQKHGCAS
jgi:riboflavin synthase